MENSKLSIEERVKNLISDTLGADISDVIGEANLTNDLGADSLDTVEVIMVLEKEFNIMIPDDIAEIVEKLFTEEIEVDLSNQNVEGRV